MRSTRHGVGGQLARQLLAFLLAVAWLPLVALLWTSLRQFEGRLAAESAERMSYRAKSSGLEIFGRLKSLLADLEIVGQGLAPTDLAVDLLPRWPSWRDRFDALVVTPSPSAAALATLPNLPTLDLEKIERLEQDGRPVLVEGPSGQRSLWLVARHGRQPGPLLWARIRWDWLWQDSGSEPAEGVAWVLLGAGGRETLAETSNPPSGLRAHYETRPTMAARHFAWRDGSRRYLASSWTIPLGYEFAHPGITMLVNEPDVVGESLAALRRQLVLLAVGALLLVAWLGIRRLRSDLGPLERLTEGSRLIAAGDFATRVEVKGRSEVARLSHAFNAMAGELESQSRHRAELLEELERAHWGALTALARAVDAKSPWTHGHSSRVTDIAIAIALEIGLDEEKVRRVRRGALVHDVGKIGVPGKLLGKPTSLTDDETAIMRSHVEQGVRILEPIPGLADVLPIVWQHHERLDGMGYPKGLRGDEIDPLAALVAVADVFEALTAARPYRPAWELERVENYLQRYAGLRYDRRCVEAILRIHSRHRSWKTAIEEHQLFPR